MRHVADRRGGRRDNSISGRIAGSGCATAFGGAPLSAGALAAAKGAGIFIAAKIKAVALITAFVVAIPVTVVINTIRAEPAPPAVQPPATGSPVAVHAPPDAPFEQAYAVPEDAVIVQIRPPFPSSRLEWCRRDNPEMVDANSGGPSGIMVRWKDGKPMIRGSAWSDRGSFSLASLCGHLDVSRAEIEGDDKVIDYVFHGDFAYRAEASKEELRAGIEKIISDELGRKIELSFRDVQRPITVLKGAWNYKPPEGAGAPRTPNLPQIEMYGSKLSERRAGTGETDIKGLSQTLSNWIRKPILIEGDGAPEKIRYNFYYTKLGPGLSIVDPSKEAGLVI